MRNYHLVGEHNFSQMLQAVEQASLVALDTETTCLNVYSPDFQLVAFAVATDENTAWYLPVAHENFLLEYQPPNLTGKQVQEFLNLVLRKPLVFHNAAYDIRVIAHTCRIPIEQIHGDDTMLALHLMDENHPLSLKAWAKTLLNLEESSAVIEPPELLDSDFVYHVNPATGRKSRRKEYRLKPDWMDLVVTTFKAHHNGGVSFDALYAYIAKVFQQIKHRGLVDFPGAFPKNFQFFPVQIAHIYALDDAINTLNLWRHVEIFFDMNPQLYKLYTEIELPVNRIMTRATHTGILVDKEALLEVKKQINARMEEKAEEAKELLRLLLPLEVAEQYTNPLNSPMQLSEILYTHLGYKVVEETAKGQASTSKTALSKLLELKPKNPAKAPLAKAFLEAKVAYEALKKLASTYTDSILDQLDPHDVLHTSFNTVGTVSGRMSSSDPNLQNLPRLLPEELESKPYLQGIDIRRVFKARPGKVFVAADYTSMELVVCAAVSGDATMRELLNQGRDLHVYTAKYAFKIGTELDDKDFKKQYKDLRQKAKIVNFALIYGGTEFTLMKNFNFPENEAKALIAGYFEAYPGVASWMDSVYRQLETTGYVTYPDYHYIKRMDLPEALRKLPRSKWPLVLNNDREAKRQYMGALRSCQNALIQGYSAFVVKEAIVNIQNELDARKIPAQVVAQVHDEIVCEADAAFAAEVVQVMLRHMQRVVNGVNLSAEPEVKYTLSKAEEPLTLDQGALHEQPYPTPV